MIISPNPARRDSIRDTVSADNEQCIVATATAPTAQPQTWSIRKLADNLATNRPRATAA
jgi:hypothetical protein